MTELAVAVAAMLICSAVMGRILFWIDNTPMTDRITRKLMDYLSWDYEEIKASAVGVWYYLTPAAFIAVFCIVFDHNIFAYLRIDLQDLGYIPVTILAEMSVVTMVSGSLTLSPTGWTGRRISAISAGSVPYRKGTRRSRRWFPCSGLWWKSAFSGEPCF